MLTARASVPGVQRLAAAAAEVDGVRDLTSRRLVALVGAHRLPRLLADVVAASLPATSDQGQVVLLPGRRDFAVQGVTSSDLPRQLAPAGARLLRATGSAPASARALRRWLRRARGAVMTAHYLDVHARVTAAAQHVSRRPILGRPGRGHPRPPRPLRPTFPARPAAAPTPPSASHDHPTTSRKGTPS